jgi:hypothetical protein
MLPEVIAMPRRRLRPSEYATSSSRTVFVGDFLPQNAVRAKHFGRNPLSYAKSPFLGFSTTD